MDTVSVMNHIKVYCSGPEYYYIHFDKNGIANLVEKSGPIGG